MSLPAIILCNFLLGSSLTMPSLPYGLEIPHLSPLEMCGMISVLLAVSYLRRRSDPVRLQVKFPAAQIHIPSLQIHAIPTVGPSWPLLSYLGAWRYFRDAKGMILEGYSKVSQLAGRQRINPH